MKSFSQYLESKKRGHTAFGVPWYSSSDTPSIRPTLPSGDSETGRMRYDALKNKHSNLTGRRFAIKEGGFFDKAMKYVYVDGERKTERKYPPGIMGTITNVGGMNITYILDNETKKRTYGVFSFLKSVDLLPEDQSDKALPQLS